MTSLSRVSKLELRSREAETRRLQVQSKNMWDNLPDLRWYSRVPECKVGCEARIEIPTHKHGIIQNRFFSGPSDFTNELKYNVTPFL